MKKLLKIFSVSMASLTLCASPIMPQVSAVSPNSANNKSLYQKAKDLVWNHKGELIFGAASVASAAVLFKILENVDVERYIDSRVDRGVSADLWFERLGGTQKYIREYMNFFNNNEGIIVRKSLIEEYGTCVSKGFGQIEKDINRTFHSDNKEVKCISEALNIDVKEIANEILKIWQLKHNNKLYTQGMDSYLMLILTKFAKNYDSRYDKKDEIAAKACYIFTKMMDVVLPRYFDAMLTEKNLIHKVAKDFTNRMKKGLSVRGKNDFDKLVKLHETKRINILCHLNSQFLQCGMGLYGYYESTKIWDKIILNNEITTRDGFNSNNFQRVMDAILGTTIVRIYNDNEQKIRDTDDINSVLGNLYNPQK
ncbi:MAG: hypothetical protein ACI4PR_05535 [Acutalibacteraceae bacterium]